MGHSVKALAFFVGLAVAGSRHLRPMNIARQDAGTTTATTSSGTAAETGNTNEPVIATAVVEATLSGTERSCSADYVTAYTSTKYATMMTTTSPLYTMDIRPTVGK